MLEEMEKIKRSTGVKAVYVICVLALTSCYREKCEAFNLKRIPYDLKHFQETVHYSNGIDTLTFNGLITDFTKESTINPLSNPECNPSLSIESMGEPFIKHHPIKIAYYFNYYRENAYTDFSFRINRCVVEDIKIDADFIADLKAHKEVVFENIHNENQDDSTRTLRKISMKDMRITYFEFLNGEKWHLIKK